QLGQFEVPPEDLEDVTPREASLRGRLVETQEVDREDDASGHHADLAGFDVHPPQLGAYRQAELLRHDEEVPVRVVFMFSIMRVSAEDVACVDVDPQSRLAGGVARPEHRPCAPDEVDAAALVAGGSRGGTPPHRVRIEPHVGRPVRPAEERREGAADAAALSSAGSEMRTRPARARPFPIQPDAPVVAPGGRERRPRELLGVEAEGHEAGIVPDPGEGAGDRLGLDVIAQAAVVTQAGGCVTCVTVIVTAHDSMIDCWNGVVCPSGARPCEAEGHQGHPLQGAFGLTRTLTRRVMAKKKKKSEKKGRTTSSAPLAGAPARAHQTVHGLAEEAARETEDLSLQRHDEETVLSAIYGKDFRVEEGAWNCPTYRIRIRPAGEVTDHGGSANDASLPQPEPEHRRPNPHDPNKIEINSCEVTLNIQLNQKYPHSKPLIQITDTVNVFNHQLSDLLRLLQAKATECSEKGYVMGLELGQIVESYLVDLLEKRKEDELRRQNDIIKKKVDFAADFENSLQIEDPENKRISDECLIDQSQDIDVDTQRELARQMEALDSAARERTERRQQRKGISGRYPLDDRGWERGG
ncbi:hypothetical protein THAOC_37513, partial [Thalassiosira oceanica]